MIVPIPACRPGTKTFYLAGALCTWPVRQEDAITGFFIADSRIRLKIAKNKFGWLNTR
jgi:hypothetical protein